MPSSGPNKAAAPAPRRVRALAFDCVRQLLLWPGLTEPGNRPLLRALLAAFHKAGPQPAEEGGSGRRVSMRLDMLAVHVLHVQHARGRRHAGPAVLCTGGPAVDCPGSCSREGSPLCMHVLSRCIPHGLPPCRPGVGCRAGYQALRGPLHGPGGAANRGGALCRSLTRVGTPACTAQSSMAGDPWRWAAQGPCPHVWPHASALRLICYGTRMPAPRPHACSSAPLIHGERPAGTQRLPPAPLPQLPSMDSDQPATESPSHQHACLVILDALATLLDRLNSTGAARELWACKEEEVFCAAAEGGDERGRGWRRAARAGSVLESGTWAPRHVGMTSAVPLPPPAELSKASLSLKSKLG